MKGKFLTDSSIQINNLQLNSKHQSSLNTAFAQNKFGSNVIASNPIKDTYSFSSSSNKKVEKKSFNFGQVRQKLENYFQYKQFQSLANEKNIQCMIAANPEINSILGSVGLKPQIYLNNLYNMYDSHFMDTANIAKEIGKNLKLSQKEMQTLEKGALFHDFGKVLIPEEILEKPAELTPEERKIVSKHAVLGYELLKTTGMEPEVLEIIKNHHKYKYNLPQEGSSKLSQIVTVADIYSALTTDRPYKKAMSHEQAMKILDKLSDEEKIDKTIVNALKEDFDMSREAA